MRHPCDDKRHDECYGWNRPRNQPCACPCHAQTELARQAQIAADAADSRSFTVWSAD